MVAFQGLFVVTVVGHSLEDLGNECIIAKQVVYQTIWLKSIRLEVEYYFRLWRMRSDKHQPEVLQAVSVRQVLGCGYEARAGGHQHQHQEG